MRIQCLNYLKKKLEELDFLLVREKKLILEQNPFLKKAIFFAIFVYKAIYFCVPKFRNTNYKRKKTQIKKVKKMLTKCKHFKHLASLNATRKFSSSSCHKDESGYQQVPHYKQKSALYIRPPLSTAPADAHDVFPNIISPDLDLNALFGAQNSLKAAINKNLIARHTHLNTVKLRDDYTQMKALEAEIKKLDAEKHSISNSINNLVKNPPPKHTKKSVMQTDEAKRLLSMGNEVKHKMTKLLDELIPLEEIVRIACLRLPNDLHFSTYYVHHSQLAKDTESEDELVLFDFNQTYLSDLRRNTECLSSSRSWQHTLG